MPSSSHPIRAQVQRGVSLFALVLALASPTLAAEVGSTKFPDQVTVGGKPLVFNGGGIRYKAVFKVYAAGLYLPRKSDSPVEAISTPEPRRLTIVMLREIDSAELGKMFSKGMEENMERSAMARLVPGIVRMSQVFSQHKRLQEGDSFTIDWVPGTGTLLSIKGEPPGEPFREPEFFQTLMRIWLGNKPADFKLKDALLGVKPS